MTQDAHAEARSVFEGRVPPALDRLRASGGEDRADDLAGWLLHHICSELGWSMAYYTKVDALHYWCLTSGRDLDELTDPLRAEFEAFWATWVTDRAWTDAMWLDDYTGDSIVELMRWHIKQGKEG